MLGAIHQGLFARRFINDAATKAGTSKRHPQAFPQFGALH
jgi:hypothetical protein